MHRLRIYRYIPNATSDATERYTALFWDVWHSEKNARKELERHLGKKGALGNTAREILQLIRTFATMAKASGKRITTNDLYDKNNGLVSLLHHFVQESYRDGRCARFPSTTARFHS